MPPFTPPPAIAPDPDLWDQNPAWAARAGVVHGLLRRRGLETRGKLAFPEMIGLASPHLLAMAGGGATLIGADQVHEDAVAVVHADADLAAARVSDSGAGGAPAYEFPATDALVTTRPGDLLIIQTADCLPILFLDPVSGVAGACHCGWRGLIARLGAKTVAAMTVAGARPERVEAWIGPGICVDHYEVGSDLVGKFAAQFPGAPVSPDGRRLDLIAAARAQLADAGLAPANIAAHDGCTFHDADRLHSYRRDGPGAGRLLTVIGLRR